MHAPSEIPFVRDDGGRRAAGFPGEAGDCACRAIAIATRTPYRQVHRRLTEMGCGRPVDEGVMPDVSSAYLSSLGWVFTLNQRRNGRYRRIGDLGRGRYILELHGASGGHLAALVDGELHDLKDNTTAAVWGWWSYVAIVAHIPISRTLSCRT